MGLEAKITLALDNRVGVVDQAGNIRMVWAIAGYSRWPLIGLGRLIDLSAVWDTVYGG